jgi:hypothetical protein
VAVAQANLTIAESQVTNLTTDLASKALTSRTISTTAPLQGGGDLSADRTLSIDAATTLASGVVQLSTSTSSISTTLAATPSAVKSAYDLANAAAPKTTTISTTSPLSGGGDLSTNRTLSIADASTTAKGAVQLTDSTSSTSTTTAATPNSVKTAYDLANAALPKSGGTMSGAIAMGSNKVTGLANGTVSTDAAAYGQLPTLLTTTQYQCTAVTLSSGSANALNVGNLSMTVTGYTRFLITFTCQQAAAASANNTIINLYFVPSSGTVSGQGSSGTPLFVGSTTSNLTRAGHAVTTVITLSSSSITSLQPWMYLGGTGITGSFGQFAITAVALP